MTRPTWILWWDTPCRCYTWPGAWRSRPRPHGAGRVATPWTEAPDASSPGTWQLPALVCCWPERKMNVQWARFEYKRKKSDIEETFFHLIFERGDETSSLFEEVCVLFCVFYWERKNGSTSHSGARKYLMCLDVFGCEAVKNNLECYVVKESKNARFYSNSGARTFTYNYTLLSLAKPGICPSSVP